MVVAMTIANSPGDVKVDPNIIWRDVGFYIVSTCTLIIFALIGELTLVSISIMFGIYLSLVLTVWY